MSWQWQRPRFLLDGENADALIRLIELAVGTIQFWHSFQSAVVQSNDFPTALIEDWASAAAFFRRGAIVQLLRAAGEQAVVVQRKFQVASSGMSDDVHAWRGLCHLDRRFI